MAWVETERVIERGRREREIEIESVCVRERERERPCVGSWAYVVNFWHVRRKSAFGVGDLSTMLNRSNATVKNTKVTTDPD